MMCSGERYLALLTGCSAWTLLVGSTGMTSAACGTCSIICSPAILKAVLQLEVKEGMIQCKRDFTYYFAVERVIN